MRPGVALRFAWECFWMATTWSVPALAAAAWLAYRALPTRPAIAEPICAPGRRPDRGCRGPPLLLGQRAGPRAPRARRLDPLPGPSSAPARGKDQEGSSRRATPGGQRPGAMPAMAWRRRPRPAAQRPGRILERRGARRPASCSGEAPLAMAAIGRRAFRAATLGRSQPMAAGGAGHSADRGRPREFPARRGPHRRLGLPRLGPAWWAEGAGEAPPAALAAEHFAAAVPQAGSGVANAGPGREARPKSGLDRASPAQLRADRSGGERRPQAHLGAARPPQPLPYLRPSGERVAVPAILAAFHKPRPRRRRPTTSARPAPWPDPPPREGPRRGCAPSILADGEPIDLRFDDPAARPIDDPAAGRQRRPEAFVEIGGRRRPAEERGRSPQTQVPLDPPCGRTPTCILLPLAQQLVCSSRRRNRRPSAPAASPAPATC